MTIARFPHTHAVTLANGELAAAPRAPIHTGAPPQFGGIDSVWSPEELLVGAALLCLQTTFDALVRRESVRIHSWRGAATRTFDKTPEALRVRQDGSTSASRCLSRGVATGR